MKYFFNRIIFKLYLNSHIIVLWVFWFPQYYFKIKEIKRTLNFLNNEIPSFSTQFPHLNYRSFNKHSKYWLHWIRKMDPRERHIFKEWNPIILLNDEEWLHLDLTKPDVQIIAITFYWPDSEWITIKIFESLNEMKNYISRNIVSAKQLSTLVNRLVSSETLARGKEKRKMANNNHDDSFYIDENGDIVFSPEYLDEEQKKFKEYRKTHPKR